MNIVAFGQHFDLSGSYPHRHDHWEIIYNIEGDGTATAADQQHPFSTGTIILQPPGIYHDKESVHLFSDMFLEVDRLPLPRLSGSDAPFHIYQDSREQEFYQLLQIAYRHYHAAPHRKPLIDALYDAMLELLNDWTQTQSNYSPEVTWLESLIRERYADPELDLPDLLQSGNYHPDHLRKLFKAQLGMTPFEYLRQLRIEQAKRLLQDGKLMIRQVAEQVGYYDAHYFNRVFKAATGVTPSTWQHRE